MYKLYKIIFVQYHKLFTFIDNIKSSRMKTALWKTNIVLSFLLLFNAMTIGYILEKKYDLVLFSLSGNERYIIYFLLFFGIYGLHALLFPKSERYLQILKEYESEKGLKKGHVILALVYPIFTVFGGVFLSSVFRNL